MFGMVRARVLVIPRQQHQFTRNTAGVNLPAYTGSTRIVERTCVMPNVTSHY